MTSPSVPVSLVELLGQALQELEEDDLLQVGILGRETSKRPKFLLEVKLSKEKIDELRALASATGPGQSSAKS